MTTVAAMSTGWTFERNTGRWRTGPNSWGTSRTSVNWMAKDSRSRPANSDQPRSFTYGVIA
ncbi:hypothetical protein CXF35_04175 [Corynebacterium bovis]|nr:hypothetical protein CXF40_05965 [Corynebacterium bovis]RRO95259.1 hypothetical protein CXF32_07810 [Corynebacterium bovis]RRQ06808.1 hypothetical protein CXF43_06855 [Corynebacterium bovis]RRQ16415.1 hypothetical protein CXF35_04175 [Corynebacterium bovis]RRQ18580.1 hypothetical protein CXF33_06935 [Corynebacterium bovis]